ncbi:MAG: hypothetical protein E7484_01865 [Ruminococcaceae bacterium]|nr:hypothetical protein [Oscillospiraceae bacterium]
MKLCSCSERPLGIVDSRVVMKENKPYQLLRFGCTNKKCAKYHNIVAEKYVNLLDNTDTFTLEI